MLGISFPLTEISAPTGDQTGGPPFDAEQFGKWIACQLERGAKELRPDLSLRLEAARKTALALKRQQ